MPKRIMSPEKIAIMEKVKTIIGNAGSGGISAEGIAHALGLMVEGQEMEKEDRQQICAEIRGIARNVVKKENWSRGQRQGLTVLYSATSPTQAEKDKAEALAEARKSKRAEKKAAKAKKEDVVEEEDVADDDVITEDDEANFDDTDE